MSYRSVETAMYRGLNMTVMLARPTTGGQFVPLLCENRKEEQEYTNLFASRPPYRLSRDTPLGRPCRKGHDIIAEVIEPPARGWPWLIGFFWPDGGSELQRGHWSFEVFDTPAEVRAFSNLVFANINAAKPGLPLNVVLKI